jgi:segregation and condensation protein B
MESSLDTQPNEEKQTDNQTTVQVQEALPLSAIVSALLFTHSRPLSIETLCAATGAEAGEIEAALAAVRSMYQADLHGFALEQAAGGYQLRTSEQAASAVRAMSQPRVKRLSRAAAETLAVIAYKQPVQRAEIEAIRGVDALPTLKTLLDAKLVRLVGHDAAVGQPALYGTTERFLERFGLNDLDELPSLREIEQFSSEPGEADDAAAEGEVPEVAAEALVNEQPSE